MTTPSHIMPAGQPDPAVAAQLAAAQQGLQVRTNRNRQTLVSLRTRRDRTLVLSIRSELLIPELLPELTAFVRRRGQGAYPLLRQHMQRLFEDLTATVSISAPTIDPQVLTLPVLGPGPIDLQALADAIHRHYHADLPPVPAHWSRATASNRRLRSIRFGTYRPGPPPRISIHPRLGQAWVARCFLELVIHHEYCHHRQHCRPGLGRRMGHGPRFRSLEQRFSALTSALAWERSFLSCLLDPARPRPSIAATTPPCPIPPAG